MESRRYTDADEKRFLELIDEHEAVRREEARRAHERFWGHDPEQRRTGFQPNPG